MNPREKAESSQFFVYTHSMPDGRIFYVGKGRKSRALKFVRERHPQYNQLVDSIGRRNVVVHLYPCETEAEAFAKEIELLEYFRPETNRIDGMRRFGRPKRKRTK